MHFDLTVPEARIWTRANAAVFCRVADTHGEFSNMNRHFPYEDAGLNWLGTEAQYQAMRFPHLPEHQEAIRLAPSLMAAKKVAYERVAESRPDWNQVNLQAMAYVLTRKLATPGFAQALLATGTQDIVELSVRDDFWGAKPQGNSLTGRNMLGHLLMQLRAGARMDAPPSGTTFPQVQKPVPAANNGRVPMYSHPRRQVTMPF